MGVGIAVFIVVGLVAIMIIPTGYSEDDENRYLSYEEKKQKELDRLNQEYKALEPNEGGPPTEELIDFQQLRLDEIKELEYGILELQEVIDVKIIDVKNQNEIIAAEQKAIATAKEKIKKDWGAAPADYTKLIQENKKLQKLNDQLGELVTQRDLILKQIESKKLIYDIQKHDAKLIGVQLSKNCIAMAKLNMTTCPTYEDLYHLDSSIVKTSGEFSWYDGYFHREKSNYQNSYRAYDNDDKIRIIVDPPHNESARIKMITIESNLGYYSTAYSKDLVDGKRILSKDRVIHDCYTARISADNYKMLLPDTIFTFRNGCESAEIIDTVEYEMPETNFSIWSSPNIQYQQWVLEMKEKCKELF